jgi:chromosome partitioning protein
VRAAKLLTVSSSKGGACKTTTARNLAVIAAHAGIRVATVDLDAQQTLTIWHKRRPGAAPAIDHRAIPTRDCNDRIAALVASGGFDLVIVDTPPGVEGYPAEMRMLVRKSHFCLLTTQQQSADLDSVIGWSEIVRREGARFAFLLSRTFRNRRNYSEAKQRLIEAGPLCPFDIRDLASVDRTDKLGVGNIEIRGDLCGEDFKGVWRYVSRELGLGDGE